jgi:formamidopyrimidine-DNA glycosylase
MPELPEVETIRRQLAPHVAGRRITAVQVGRARAVRAHAAPEEFIARLQGRRICELTRRGKALLFLLEGDRSLLVRLGMSGQLVLADPADPLVPHTHVRLSLDDGRELRFIDPRTFGQMAVVDGHDPDHMIELGHYGPEPLSDAFTPAVLAAAMAGKAASVQAVLMDQTKVVGVGKIYADEACFLARVDPRRPAGSLTAEEIGRLHAAVREVLEASIACRGTSSKDSAYRDAHGGLGNFQCQLNVYQRAGQPCRACGTLVEYRPFQGRRMHFCPHCQR